jgi:hypothetical protein
MFHHPPYGDINEKTATIVTVQGKLISYVFFTIYKQNQYIHEEQTLR